MDGGLAIFGSVSAALTIFKDIESFVQKVKKADVDIRELNLKIEDDLRSLERYHKILKDYNERLDGEDGAHLRHLIARITSTAQEQKRSIDNYRKNRKTERFIWAKVGPGLQQAERELAGWIARLRHALDDHGLLDLSRQSTQRDQSNRSFAATRSRNGSQVSLHSYFDIGTSLVGMPDKDATKVPQPEPSIDLETIKDEFLAYLLDEEGELRSTLIARQHLKQILEKHGIRDLLMSDDSIKSFSPGPYMIFDKPAFVKDVITKAISLLSVCMLANIDLVHLKDILGTGVTDEHIPLTHLPLVDQARRPLETEKFFRWQEYVESGTVSGLEPSSAYQQRIVLHLADKTIGVPVPVEETWLSENGKIGSGAFGTVYICYIKQLPKKIGSGIYARKQFRSQDTDSWRRELAALRKIGTQSHPHLVFGLASWKTCEKLQSPYYHILYPLAAINLRQMLQRRIPSTSSDRAIDLWILSQLIGLIDGIRHIHEQLSVRHKTSQQLCQICSHNDIKPSNILVYPGESAHNVLDSTWMISDFGMSVFCDSRPPRKFRTGTVPYRPPRQTESADPNRQLSDVFSFGCVVLEVAEWALLRPQEKGQQCIRDRLDEDLSQANLDRLEEESFWCVGVHNPYTLRPAVRKTLRQLRKVVKSSGVVSWSLILDSVEQQMLQVVEGKRSTSATVTVHFRACLTALRTTLPKDARSMPAHARDLSSGRKHSIWTPAPSTLDPDNAGAARSSKKQSAHKKSTRDRSVQSVSRRTVSEPTSDRSATQSDPPGGTRAAGYAWRSTLPLPAFPNPQPPRKSSLKSQPSSTGPEETGGIVLSSGEHAGRTRRRSNKKRTLSSSTSASSSHFSTGSAVSSGWKLPPTPVRSLSGETLHSPR